jgi:polyisoprenoid-binding protein YceI
MKTQKFILLSGVVILLSAFTISESIAWKITDKYSVAFAGTDAEGIFKELKGTVQFDEANLSTSSASFTIPVNSINTGNGTKNKHAVSDKWFDADTYPNIKFVSKNFSKTASGYQVTGTMEIHGTKKEVTIPFTFTDNTFKSNFSVKRMDYGVGTMNGMSKKVSDEIKLTVSIPVTK